jgi:hypothetical protein
MVRPSLNLDKSEDLSSSNCAHDQYKDENPRDVALLYQLISNAVSRCQRERCIRPSLQGLPTARFQGAERKIVGDGQEHQEE